uniref:Uncharacterized protein n=1 Tax=Romanomermis culicivorax TaxID=13658 RepID=A0A915IF82_ROMCU
MYLVPKGCETAMIVSATSWTPDENFDLLLSALKIYESKKIQNEKLPNLLMVITGKGPLKDFYVKKARECGKLF